MPKLPKKSKSPKYDPQRNEVYFMEKYGLFGLNRSRLTRPELRDLLDLACAKFDLEPPKLRYNADNRYAGEYRYEPRPTITMSTCYSGGLSAMTLLHETAHYIVHQADPEDSLTPHGPEFLGVYGDLMECSGFVVFGGWHLLIKQFGLHCLDTGRLTPAQLMQAIKKRAAEAAPKSPHSR